MRLLVDACYLVAAGVLAPAIAWRSRTTGKYRADWDQRRGFLPDLPAGRRRAWVHAVSVGEVNAARGIVNAWRAEDPELEIVISTTTDTGLARARQVFGDLPVVRYPLDFSWFVRRALDRIKPTLVVLVELEVWYQFVTLAAARGIPVAVINGRLSERSVRRFGWVRGIVRRMFDSLAWVGAQDEDYADRFRRMGVPAGRVSVTGSVKWDGAEVTDRVAGAEPLARAMGLRPDLSTWVAGSTGPGEEEIILKALASVRARHPDLQLVIVPRKPERFDEVAELIRRHGFTCIRRTGRPDGSSGPAPAADAAPPVWLGDTMGELRKIYCLARVVFVGRSLAAMGGSDAMEVAALAKPVIVGPHNENFADTIARFRQADAIRVLEADGEDPTAASGLAEAVLTLLDRPAEAEAMGRRGRDVVLASRGATRRTLERLMEMSRVQHPAP